MKELLNDAASRAWRYISRVADRHVAPYAEDVARLRDLGGPMPETPSDPAMVLAQLDDIGSPATVASSGGRFFGFVIGGALPAALAANWLAAAWDQNACLRISSPVAAELEDISIEWLRDLLKLPPTAGAGFVTGATMANFTCLAAARGHLLNRAGWNVEEKGLFGAPPLSVIVGEEAHVTLLKALAMLGLGRARVAVVPTDDQGRMRAELLPALDDRSTYLQTTEAREPSHYTPEASRRARGVECWAALYSLGRRGLAEMVERNCQLASCFADHLRQGGCTILNDVVLNQVLVSFGDDLTTRRVIQEVQNEGTCWCGGTQWHGRAAMRISVSNWATTSEDINRSAAAILRIAKTLVATGA